MDFHKSKLILTLGAAAIALQAQTDTVTFQAAPQPPVQGVSVAITGNPGPGVYFYWVIANFPGGSSVPIFPAGAINAPSPLTGGNFITVSWEPDTGATSYDLLRTTTTSLPSSGTCICAVATGLTGTSATDTGSPLSSYTISAKPPAFGYIHLDNTGATPRFTTSPALTGGTGGLGSANCGTATPAAGAVAPTFSATVNCVAFTVTGATTVTPAGMTGSGPYYYTVTNQTPTTAPLTYAGIISQTGLCQPDASTGGAITIITMLLSGSTLYPAACTSATAASLAAGQIPASNGNVGPFKAAIADNLATPVYAADTGAANALAATLSPAISAYTSGTLYRIKSANANTAATTVNFNAIGAVAVTKVVGGIGTALASGDICSGQELEMVYDGTRMQLTSPVCNALTLSAVNAQSGTYSVTAADFSGYKTIYVASGTFTITLVASGSQPPNGQYINVINAGGGVVTIARNGQNINGAASNLTLNAASATAPSSAFVESDGTNYVASVNNPSSGGGTSYNNILMPFGACNSAGAMLQGPFWTPSDSQGVCNSDAFSNFAVWQFLNAGASTLIGTVALPPNYNSGGTVSAILNGFPRAGGSTGNVEFDLKTSCTTPGAVFSGALTYNTASAPIVAIGTTANQLYQWNFSSVPMSGSSTCHPGDWLWLNLTRNTGTTGNFASYIQATLFLLKIPVN